MKHAMRKMSTGILFLIIAFSVVFDFEVYTLGVLHYLKHT